MNNEDVTQKVIFEKMLQYIEDTCVKQDVSVKESNIEEQNHIEVAYQYLNKIIEAQQITSIRPILKSRKGIVGKLGIILKKIIRRLALWYVEPICESQTYYNRMNVQVLIQMFYQLQKMEEENNDGLKEDIEFLKKCNRKLQEEMAEYNQLRERYVELNKKCEKQDWKLESLQLQNDRNVEQLLYVSKETRKVSDDMQIVRREAGEMFKGNVENFWNKVTVAQSGEDAIVDYILMVLGIDLKNEHYLDLGANHAKQLSNTYMFYQKGMRGVLVEANPKLVEELKFYRNEDIVLNKCIAEASGKEIKFYILNGDGLSSQDLDTINDVIAKNPMLYIEKTIEVDTITINELMQQYFTKAPLILNVDIEGMEEKILSTLDYKNYAPFIIIVERIEYSTVIATQKCVNDIEKIMEENGYFEYAFTGINSIYINKKRLEEIQNENCI